MRHEKTRLFELLALLAALGIGTVGFGQNSAETDSIVDPLKVFRVTEGFRAQLVAKPRAGALLTINAGFNTWSIEGSLGKRTIRTKDFTMFHLRAGKLVIQTDGKEEIKRPDSFWTSPAGAVLTLQVKGETAVLEVMTASTR